MVSFTAGVVAATSLFAYSSRIPIPIKITPTRGADDLLSRPQDTDTNDDLQFQQRLQDRVIATDATKAPPAPTQIAPPQLPQSQPQLTPVAATAEPAPATTTPPVASLAHYVQAGAYADEQAAANLRETLAGQGFPTIIRSDRDNLHRVVIGPYEQAGAAEEVRAQLALQGRSTQILRLPQVTSQ